MELTSSTDAILMTNRKINRKLRKNAFRLLRQNLIKVWEVERKLNQSQAGLDWISDGPRTRSPFICNWTSEAGPRIKTRFYVMGDEHGSTEEAVKSKNSTTAR